MAPLSKLRIGRCLFQHLFKENFLRNWLPRVLPKRPVPCCPLPGSPLGALRLKAMDSPSIMNPKPPKEITKCLSNDLEGLAQTCQNPSSLIIRSEIHEKLKLFLVKAGCFNHSRLHCYEGGRNPTLHRKLCQNHPG